MKEPLAFDLGQEGRTCCGVVCNGSGESISSVPLEYQRKVAASLPELSEPELMRHYTALSRLNFGVDNGFYPLGSCTMKYNPKINEDSASLPGYSCLHPLQETSQIQGMLELLYSFLQYLTSVFGFSRFSLNPVAGAHGEFTALLMAKQYFTDLGQQNRNKIIIPESAHGTNPASAALAGFETVGVISDADGGIDLDSLLKVLGPDTAMLMLTNPNTLGLFDRNILKISKMVHDAGGLMYMDGANANANMGKVLPTDLGFDMCHINLHKTFSTPHGGGGPGAGPVGATKKLEKYLPVPRVSKNPDGYIMEADVEGSIGTVHSFAGNAGVIVKAYTYVRTLGAAGLKKASESAVLNANYMMAKLKDYYYLPYDRVCQHEFVISAKWQKQKYGVRALDIAKRLIDYGFHPPTIYFPLIVEEAMMIEPTETESKETLDRFIETMILIAKECESNPDIVKKAPHTTIVGRLDEVKAVKDLNICYKS